MAIYFKCPHCGNGSVDELGETAIDYDNGLFKCTECGNLLSVEEDLISYEDYLEIWKEQENKNMTREEAIKIVKEFINGTCLHLVDQEALKTLIPELAESEDERVEKLITDSVFYQYGAGVEYKDVLDYLDRHNGKTHNSVCGVKINGEPVPVENQFINVENQSSQEWSDEDERIRQTLIDFFGSALGKDLLQRKCRLDPDTVLAYLEKQKEQSDENIEDIIIYHPLKNGKGEYECIPYSFYGSLSSFTEDKDLIDFLRTCFYTEEECNEWIEQQRNSNT